MSRSPLNISTGTLSARITERLRRAILDAELELGEALSEDKLAVALGVSRTPVRDSLTALQTQGLIDIKPQRGSYVFLPSTEDVAALCEIRSIFEVQAFRLSLARNRNATLEKLYKAEAAMETAKAAKDYLSVAHADTDFHMALVDNCGNKYLSETFQLASGRFVALRTNILLAEGDLRRTRAISEHKSIISAIEGDRLAEAESILSVHIFEVLEAFIFAKNEGFFSCPPQGKLTKKIELTIDSGGSGA